MGFFGQQITLITQFWGPLFNTQKTSEPAVDPSTKENPEGLSCTATESEYSAVSDEETYASELTNYEMQEAPLPAAVRYAEPVSDTEEVLETRYAGSEGEGAVYIASRDDVEDMLGMSLDLDESVTLVKVTVNEDGEIIKVEAIEAKREALASLENPRASQETKAPEKTPSKVSKQPTQQAKVTEGGTRTAMTTEANSTAPKSQGDAPDLPIEYETFTIPGLSRIAAYADAIPAPLIPFLLAPFIFEATKENSLQRPVLDQRAPSANTASSIAATLKLSPTAVALLTLSTRAVPEAGKSSLSSAPASERPRTLVLTERVPTPIENSLEEDSPLLTAVTIEEGAAYTETRHTGRLALNPRAHLNIPRAGINPSRKDGGNAGEASEVDINTTTWAGIATAAALLGTSDPRNRKAEVKSNDRDLQRGHEGQALAMSGKDDAFSSGTYSGGRQPGTEGEGAQETS